ncbi:MAG: glycoside hydrolase family 130 protein [Bacteroidota bacterium]
MTLILVLSLFGLPLHAQEKWMVGPFLKVDSTNPCLASNPSSRFLCPIRHENVSWEAKDVFNPAAVAHEGKVYLLYRAQDSIGKPAGTSRIGLSWSSDGLRFTRYPFPVVYPDNDFMKQYEWEGGCEDPRMVQNARGTYVMTYTAFDGKLARLAVATSSDLLHWTKQGLAFGESHGGKYRDVWSKSGSIVSRWVNGSPVATKIGGRYWMYWGESDISLATSEDLLHWTPVEDKDGSLVSVLRKRLNSFDSRLVEPGPPAFMTASGIVLIYNSCNSGGSGDASLPSGTYAAGQALFAGDDPTRLIGRSASYFFHPEKPYEKTGQVNNVCFLEGLVRFKGRWLLYYGTADSRIAVALWDHP